MKQLETNIEYEVTNDILISQGIITKSEEREYWETLPYKWKNIFWYNIRGQWRKLKNDYEVLQVFEKNSNLVKNDKSAKKLLALVKKWSETNIPFKKSSFKPTKTPKGITSPKELLKGTINVEKTNWEQNFNQHFFYKSDIIDLADEPAIKIQKLENLFHFNPKKTPTDKFIQELFYTLLEIERIDCKNEALENLKPIGKLKKLIKITCSDNQLESLHPLGKLPFLKSIFCIHCEIKDLDGLIDSQSLERLYCGLNPISSLTPLHSLPNLKVLNCRKTKINNSDIAQLLQHLPNCNIKWKRFLF